MEFNSSKCHVIHVTTGKHPIPSKFYLHGVLLEPLNSAKYLGVDISYNLKHQQVYKNANQTLGFLYRALITLFGTQGPSCREILHCFEEIGEN